MSSSERWPWSASRAPRSSWRCSADRSGVRVVPDRVGGPRRQARSGPGRPAPATSRTRRPESARPGSTSRRLGKGRRSCRSRSSRRWPSVLLSSPLMSVVSRSSSPTASPGDWCTLSRRPSWPRHRPSSQSAGDDKTLRFWDPTGVRKQPLRLALKQPLKGVAFAGDGTWVVVCGDASVFVASPDGGFGALDLNEPAGLASASPSADGGAVFIGTTAAESVNCRSPAARPSKSCCRPRRSERSSRT